MKFSHAYTFAFEICSDMRDGSDLTPVRFRAGIVEYLARMTDIEVMENMGTPFDTYEDTVKL